MIRQPQLLFSWISIAIIFITCPSLCHGLYNTVPVPSTTTTVLSQKDDNIVVQRMTGHGKRPTNELSSPSFFSSSSSSSSQTLLLASLQDNSKEQGVQSSESMTMMISPASTSAARLLLDENNNKRISSTSTSQLDRLARQKVSEQMKLQDQRLDQCIESGKDWEQCFFYGTATAIAPTGGSRSIDISTFDSTSTSSVTVPKQDPSFKSGGSITTTKSKIPTW